MVTTGIARTLCLKKMNDCVYYRALFVRRKDSSVSVTVTNGW
jgi:hypothetical protein